MLNVARAVRREMKMTVLRRTKGRWNDLEIARLIARLTTEVCSHPKHPSELILDGHFEKEETLACLGDGIEYSSTQIVGMDSKELPFIPPFR